MVYTVIYQKTAHISHPHRKTPINPIIQCGNHNYKLCVHVWEVCAVMGVVFASKVCRETVAVTKSDTCSIINQKWTIICRNSAVSSSNGVLGRFHRSGPECSLHLCLFYGVLALSGEFLCFLFMTGNAHHKRLVSTYISAGNWARRMKKGHYHAPTQTCK